MPEGRPGAIFLDIEGTTTPIEFVHAVLFPFARQRLPALLREHATTPVVAEAVRDTAAIIGCAPVSIDVVLRQLLEWSDADQKIPPLKALQGVIWEAGFLDGTLLTPMYPDVAPALRAWRGQGVDLYVYSSGSVAAQKLLFRHSAAGDLTGLLRGHFDATVGPKVVAESYRTIAQSVAREASELLFLSDNTREIAAARTAGWRAVLVERNGPVPDRIPPAVGSFAELSL
jgi:enolase-phosphatase E1